jgi:hypothetical protein
VLTAMRVASLRSEPMRNVTVREDCLERFLASVITTSANC